MKTDCFVPGSVGHRCHVDGCPQVIMTTRIVCHAHWVALPKAVKRQAMTLCGTGKCGSPGWGDALVEIIRSCGVR